MKRSLLALGAAAVIAGLPIAAVLAGSGDSGAAPGDPIRSETTDAGTSDDPSATPESTTTVAPPPLPAPIPNSSDGTDDRDGDDGDEADDGDDGDDDGDDGDYDDDDDDDDGDGDDDGD